MTLPIDIVEVLNLDGEEHPIYELLLPEAKRRNNHVHTPVCPPSSEFLRSRTLISLQDFCPSNFLGAQTHSAVLHKELVEHRVYDLEIFRRFALGPGVQRAVALPEMQLEPPNYPTLRALRVPRRRRAQGGRGVCPRLVAPLFHLLGGMRRRERVAAYTRF